MIYPTDITNLKTDIGEKIGQKIIIKGSLGRNRPFEKEATIQKAYPSIFVVKYDENQRTVELQVFNGEEYSSIIPSEEEIKKRKREFTLS